MNENIQALAERAIEEMDQEAFHEDMVIPDEYVEKFAELLIREFEIVAKQPPHYYDSPSCGWRNPINYVCETVKQHFGVKE